MDVSYNGQSYNYNLSTTILIEMEISNNGINLTGFLKKNVILVGCRKSKAEVSQRG